MRDKKFPREDTLLVADIGGNAGTSAAELNQMRGVQAFVIDPMPFLPPEEWGLSRQRFFVRKIEETGLPDSSFHFMLSHNTMQYTDVGKAFPEIYRLLKPGGFALVEHESWYDPDILSKLERLPMKDKITVFFGGQPAIGKLSTIPLPEFIERVKSVRQEQGEKAEKGFMGLFPCFGIDKIP